MANIITVSALNKYVHSLLEGDPFLQDIAIKGEISNYTLHYKTGHCYFTIKDEKSSVKAVMFKGSAQHLAFEPQNGMSVIARCRVSLFERDGAFQIYVEDLFPDGVGAAQMAFEQLKERLSKEGLFAPEIKKPLPLYPACVGVVTSKTGAALQDILKVASHRCPDAHFLLAPVTVQGNAAAPEIANAITQLDKAGKVDVIIVARGGGSMEDLWVFNAEEIARAAFASKTPIISAIGHEIDFTILDFVADMRAPTPSAAAEIVLPDLRATYASMVSLHKNMAKNIHQQLNSWYNVLGKLQNHAALKNIHITPGIKIEQLQKITKQVQLLSSQKMQLAINRFESAAILANSLNPYAVLGRGYSITQKENIVVTSATQITISDEISIRLQDGELDCIVQNVHIK